MKTQEIKTYDYKGFRINKIKLAYKTYEVIYQNEIWEMSRTLEAAKDFIDARGEAIKQYGMADEMLAKAAQRIYEINKKVGLGKFDTMRHREEARQQATRWVNNTKDLVNYEDEDTYVRYEKAIRRGWTK